MVLSHSFHVLGLDGGGTKVEAFLLDPQGNIVSTGHGGAANSTFVGLEIAAKSVRDAVAGAVPDASLFRNITAVGTCGMIRHFVDELLLEQHFMGKLSTYSEGVLAFRRAGLKTRHGIAVIAGTGSSFAAYGDDQRVASLGGWGVGVGDEGSGFDIGLKAIKAAGRAVDGRGPQTMLLDLILNYAQVEKFWNILGMYCYPCLKQCEIAALARLVSEAAAKGDEVAETILLDTGRSLGSDAVHLARQIFAADESFDVALSGGVFSSGERVVGPLRDAVLTSFPKAAVHLPQMPAGEAAARLALEELVGESNQ